MAQEPIEWVRLPQDLQHRFFELAQEEAKRLRETIQALNSRLKGLKAKLHPYITWLPEMDEALTVAAVDSSRSPRLSERLGFRMGVFASGVVYVKGMERWEDFRAGIYRRRQALSQDKSRGFFDLLTTKYEREMALEALDRCDLLILDGSFYGFVYPAQQMKRVGLYGGEEERYVREAFEATEKLRRSGKVIGVIKRSHTRAIGGYLALEDKENPFVSIIDKLILSAVMPQGSVFSYEGLLGDAPAQLYSQLALLAASGRWPEENPMAEAERRTYAPFETLGLDKEGVAGMRRVQVRAYGDLPPCEIEYPSSLGFERLMRWLGTKGLFNEATNLPVALDLVDDAVAIPAKFTEEFTSEVEGRVLEAISAEDREVVRIFFSLLNPQKPY